MTEMEFVNRDLAESEAARAIGLLNQSDESKVEAWFAMQAVADQVGPESNTGRRGISYKPKQGGFWQYGLNATCKHGVLATTTAAPKTRDAALDPAKLDKVEALLNRKIEELGGRAYTKRPKGTGTALVEAVGASEAGRMWLASVATPEHWLLRMVRVADAYGREGVNPFAGLSAHDYLAKFENRAELIRDHVTSDQARGKSLSLQGRDVDVSRPQMTYVSPYRAATLAIRTGVTRAEARVILRAIMDGRSKAKLIRAINEAEAVLNEPRRRNGAKAA